MTPDQQDARGLNLVDLAHADGLAFARNRARDLGADLNRALARARALDLDCAGYLALDRDLDRASAIARALARAGDLDCARDLGRDLADGLNLASASARALGRDLADAPVLDLAADLVRILDRNLDHARALMRTVDQAADTGRGDQGVIPGASSRERTRARRVAPPARRLVALAAGLVPAGERARYGEEWRSEVHDLARAGAGRRQQLGHAVRLLARAVSVRQAVLAPRRGKASP